MGLWDGIKQLGRGINEARFSHETRMVPIGVDPDTGEPIEIPEDELLSKGMYDPQSKQIVMPQTKRTGKSKFGNFLSNGLPGMLHAGIAAAAAPGDGSGGVLAAIKGMQIGGQALEKRDMMAYSLARQRMQDASIQEDRAARADENRMQTEMYRRKMEEGPAVKAEPTPTSYAQLLVQRLRNETDPVKAKAIEDELRKASQGGQAPDPEKQWTELKRRATELFKPDSPEWKSFVASGGKMPAPTRPPTSAGAVQWGEGTGGKQQAFAVSVDPATGLPVSKPIVGLTRDKPKAKGPGGAKRDPNRGTNHDFLTVKQNKTKALEKAESDVREDVGKMGGNPDIKDETARAADLAARKAERWAKHEADKRAIQADFEESIVILGGSVGGAPAPQPVQGSVPVGARTPFASPGSQLWKQHPAAQPFIR